ncbi:MAG: PASTA domain-containing protein [Bacteroidales bacterium]|nr:PASTA domain-containing protein [Bacteroidales bacterium]HOI31907.1 PASTA domain-containing protein [Bacteroidales bacterium]
MKAFSFLFKKKFYLHLAIIMLLSVLLIWMIFRSLDKYTRHGEVYIVPDFTGQNLEILQDQYAGLFNFVLLDSVYVKDLPKGSVFQQDPLPGSKVKSGRNIYYVKVALMPEQVIMPNLRNLSIRQAMVLLEKEGLKVNQLLYIDHFAKNAVIEQQFQDEVIEPGTPIFKGKSIDLILGNGNTRDTLTPMPFLTGMLPAQVTVALFRAGLNPGEFYFLDQDTVSSRVFRSSPSSLPGSYAPLGKKVDIWFRSAKTFNFEELILQMQSDSISRDSLQLIINEIYHFE